MDKHNRLGSKYIELVDIENLHKALKEEAVYKTPDLQSNKAKALRILKIVCCISTSFMCVEFVGGYLSNSLAIMTDAVHLLSDVVGFLVTILAIYISKLKANSTMTYGYHRAEIIGAMISILIIWVLIAWMFVEGIERFFNPPEIQGTTMLALACCGLFFNLVLMKMLETKLENVTQENQKEELLSEFSIKQEVEKENMSMRAAQIHILGDTIQSAGVIIGALFVFFGGEDYFIADPIITIVFTVVVTFTTLPVMKDSIKVLMEGQPDDIKYEMVKEKLEKISGVVNVHDLHVWCINPGFVSLTAHICSKTPSVTLFEATKLCKKLGIVHSTIQVENFFEQEKYDYKKCEELH
ncbi:hypothetical protein ABPG72_007154 [Tetrahymena utriculariae]